MAQVDFNPPKEPISERKYAPAAQRAPAASANSPAVPLDPSGANSDLLKLKRLREEILAGKHQQYIVPPRPAPPPTAAALAPVPVAHPPPPAIHDEDAPVVSEPQHEPSLLAHAESSPAPTIGAPEPESEPASAPVSHPSPSPSPPAVAMVESPPDEPVPSPPPAPADPPTSALLAAVPASATPVPDPRPSTSTIEHPALASKRLAAHPPISATAEAARTEEPSRSSHPSPTSSVPVKVEAAPKSHSAPPAGPPASIEAGQPRNEFPPSQNPEPLSYPSGTPRSELQPAKTPQSKDVDGAEDQPHNRDHIKADRDYLSKAASGPPFKPPGRPPPRAQRDPRRVRDHYETGHAPLRRRSRSPPRRRSPVTFPPPRYRHYGDEDDYSAPRSDAYHLARSAPVGSTNRPRPATRGVYYPFPEDSYVRPVDEKLAPTRGMPPPPMREARYTRSLHERVMGDVPPPPTRRIVSEPTQEVPSLRGDPYIQSARERPLHEPNQTYASLPYAVRLEQEQALSRKRAPSGPPLVASRAYEPRTVPTPLPMSARLPPSSADFASQPAFYYSDRPPPLFEHVHDPAPKSTLLDRVQGRPEIHAGPYSQDRELYEDRRAAPRSATSSLHAGPSARSPLLETGGPPSLAERVRPTYATPTNDPYQSPSLPETPQSSLSERMGHRGPPPTRRPPTDRRPDRGREPVKREFHSPSESQMFPDRYRRLEVSGRRSMSPPPLERRLEPTYDARLVVFPGRAPTRPLSREVYREEPAHPPTTPHLPGPAGDARRYGSVSMSSLDLGSPSYRRDYPTEPYVDR